MDKKESLPGKNEPGAPRVHSVRSGKVSPTLVMALAVAVMAVIVALSLTGGEKKTKRWPLTGEKEAVGFLGQPSPKETAPPSPPPEAEKPAAAKAPEVPAPKPPVPAAPAPTPAPAPVAAKPSSPPPIPATAPTKPAAPSSYAAGGNYVVNVGMFRSQIYVIAAEDKLKSLGIPHFRDKVMRKGDGFRMTVTGPDAAKAADILKGGGYESTVGEGRMDSYFYLDKEWERAKSSLAAKGINASVEKFSGDVPVWALGCGPFSEEDAQAVVAKLKENNIADAKVSRRSK